MEIFQIGVFHLSVMNLKFPPFLSWHAHHFFLLLNNMPLPEWTTVCLSIHLLKDISVAQVLAIMNKVATNIICVQFCVDGSLYDSTPILWQLKACPWVPLPSQQMWQNAWLSSVDFVQVHLDFICMSIKAIGYGFFYLFKLKKIFLQCCVGFCHTTKSEKEKIVFLRPWVLKNPW